MGCRCGQWRVLNPKKLYVKKAILDLSNPLAGEGFGPCVVRCEWVAGALGV